MPESAMVPDRVLAMEKIHNFRYYGGYLAGGTRLKWGMLFRSAHHPEATAADLELVGRLGLMTVIDLHGPSERAAAPCPRPAGFTAQILFVDEDTTGLAPHVEAADGSPDPRRPGAAMVASYAGMPFRPRMIPILAGYFGVLTHDGLSLIHCTAGKDGTGIAVALFHSAIGVHRDDILADDLLTNVAGRIEDRIAAGASHVRVLFGKDTSDAAMRELMTVRPEYLQAAFIAIKERYGSIPTHLSEVLGVTDARRDAIADRVIGS